ncbi:hypothetical protein HK101_010805 [Irineochytrium annulatum]|nr:hypothetical protein HK101_010805 [Irineochytrium annulatum]
MHDFKMHVNDYLDRLPVPTFIARRPATSPDASPSWSVVWSNRAFRAIADPSRPSAILRRFPSTRRLTDSWESARATARSVPIAELMGEWLDLPDKPRAGEDDDAWCSRVRTLAHLGGVELTIVDATEDDALERGVIVHVRFPADLCGMSSDSLGSHASTADPHGPPPMSSITTMTRMVRASLCPAILLVCEQEGTTATVGVCNESSVKLGLAETGWVGKTFQEVLPLVEEWDKGLIEKVREEGVQFSPGIRCLLGAAGDMRTEVVLSACTIPIKDETGQFTGCAIFFNDVTNQRAKARRMDCAVDLTRHLAGASSLEDIWQVAFKSISAKTLAEDVYRAVIYRHNPDDAKVLTRVPFTDSTMSPERFAWLAATPERIELDAPAEVGVDDMATIAGIARAAWTQRSFQFRKLAGNDHSHLVGLPLGSSYNKVQGVLIVESAPTIVFDQPYQNFLRLLKHEIAMALVDISSLLEAKQRGEALAQLDKAKTTFFTAISHELRTPLTLMLGPLEDCLSSSHLTPAMLTNIQLAYTNTIRILKLIHNLLDYSRIQNGRMTASFRRVANASDLTRSLASVFRSAVEKLGIKYIVEVEDVSEDCYLDRQMWEHITFNLIGNAVKFTKHGYIRCRLYSTATHLHLDVDDSGIGIPAEELPRLFEMFHRVEQPLHHSFEGTGIGLALTEELIKMHGGTIRVESQLHTGSAFHVAIPLGFEHLPKDRVFHDAPESDGFIAGLPVGGPAVVGTDTGPQAPRAGSFNIGKAFAEEADRIARDATEKGYADHSRVADGNSPGTVPAEAATILFVVDDNSDMRKYLANVLSTRWSVRSFENGSTALTEASHSPPDLIISDIMMPIMDGLELLRRLRLEERTREVPVILLSGRSGEEARVGGLEQGADDYLAKPFSMGELVARVATKLELSRKRTELERAVMVEKNEKDNQARKYLRLATMSPIGIVGTDMTGGVTFANETFRRQFDMTEEELAELVGNTADVATKCVAEEDCEMVFATLRKAIADATGYSIEYRVWQRYAKQTIWVQQRTVVEYDGEGKPIGHLHCLMDATSSKMLEEEKVANLQREEAAQRKRADAAIEQRKQQEAFIDMICHEIRNPLNGIMNSNHFVAEVINEIQQFYDKSGDPVLADILRRGLECTDAIKLCAEHQKTQRVNMEAKQIRATVEVSPRFAGRHEEWFQGDPTRLSQILINLLTNAVKFTEKVDVKTIRIVLDGVLIEDDPPAPPRAANREALGIEGDAAEEGLGTWKLAFSVIDSGIGMTEGEKTKLFQQFSQASCKTYTEYGGSGLGLFICKRLVELMGGSIDVESEKGKGSTFKFEVLARNVPAPPRSLSERRLTGSSNPKVDRPLRFLVVDDNEINRRVLVKHLKTIGHAFETACNGREAVEMVTARHYDLDMIFMDIEMPVMRGEEATRRIRELEKVGGLPALPIVAVTGNGRREQVQHALESGMQNVLLKPFAKKE